MLQVNLIGQADCLKIIRTDIRKINPQDGFVPFLLIFLQKRRNLACKIFRLSIEINKSIRDFSIYIELQSLKLYFIKLIFNTGRNLG